MNNLQQISINNKTYLVDKDVWKCIIDIQQKTIRLENALAELEQKPEEKRITCKNPTCDYWAMSDNTCNMPSRGIHCNLKMRYIEPDCQKPDKMCGRCYDETDELFPANCKEKPELLKGRPIGQYHCPDCGAMVLAGIEHPELCKKCLERKHPAFDKPDCQKPEAGEFAKEAERWCCHFIKDRGDCLHFIGLPDKEDDTTTDEYGIPKGWCFYCWSQYQREQQHKQITQQQAEIEKLNFTINAANRFSSDEQEKQIADRDKLIEQLANGLNEYENKNICPLCSGQTVHNAECLIGIALAAAAEKLKENGK